MFKDGKNEEEINRILKETGLMYKDTSDVSMSGVVVGNTYSFDSVNSESEGQDE